MGDCAHQPAVRVRERLGSRFRAVLALGVMMAVVSSASAQQGRRAIRSWWDRAPTRWSERYLIKTDLPAAEAKAYAHHLDRMYAEFERRLASLPPRAPEKLNVFIFTSRREYVQTLRRVWGVDGQGTGGMFFVNALGSGLAFWTESLPERRVHHVIQHEGFHQFAFSRFGADLPQWVNEGLAEFFGQSVLVGNKFILGQSTQREVDAMKEAIELSAHVPFRQMLTLANDQWNANVRSGRADVYYRQAWSMVHFLVYGDDKRYQPLFERYLRLLNEGIPSERAFVRVFGPDIDAFEKRWKSYALAAKPSAFVTAIERIEFLAEGALELSRRKIVPESVAALEEALDGIGFRFVISAHGKRIELSGADHANYVIPEDDLSKEKPQFVVAKPKLRQMTPLKRKIEEERPTPSTISTDNLRPRGLEIKWVRDRKTKEISYQIIVG